MVGKASAVSRAARVVGAGQTAGMRHRQAADARHEHRHSPTPAYGEVRAAPTHERQNGHTPAHCVADRKGNNPARTSKAHPRMPEREHLRENGLCGGVSNVSTHPRQTHRRIE